MAHQRRSVFPYPGKHDPIEQHIGLRLLQSRRQRGLSQRQLGDAIGILGQQIHKYEKAQDRISGSTLYRAAQALGVPLAAFFDGFDDRAERAADIKREIEALSAAIERLPNPSVSNALLDLIAVLMCDDDPEA